MAQGPEPREAGEPVKYRTSNPPQTVRNLGGRTATACLTQSSFEDANACACQE